MQTTTMYNIKKCKHNMQHIKKCKCRKDGSECTTKPRLPTVNVSDKIPKLFFENYGDTFDHPLVVFADFETFQSPVVDKTRGDHTKVLATMTGVASYGYFVCSSIPDIPSSGVIKRGTADEFIIDMLKLGLQYRHFCLNPVDIIITETQEHFHDNAEQCYL